MRTALFTLLLFVPSASAVEPLLRLEPDAPTSTVTALAFSPDGKTLFATGLDKVVRVWEWNENAARFDYRRDRTLRVPIGPGISGGLNCLSVSPDGRYVVTAGNAIVREQAGFREPGIILPRSAVMNEDMLRDQGTIFVFDLEKPDQVKLLRGHRGSVTALSFASGRDGVIVSASREATDKPDVYQAFVRAWDIVAGKELASTLVENANPGLRPSLAAWSVGQEKNQLHVAIAWDDAALRFWNVAKNETSWKIAPAYTSCLIYDATNRRLLSGGNSLQGRVKLWDVANDPNEVGELVLPNIGAAALFPRALTFLDPKTVAMIVRAPDLGNQFHLYTAPYDGANNAIGPIASQRKLWEGIAQLPSIASSARHLAISGYGSNEIDFFDTKKLANEPQRLLSPVHLVKSVAFVKKGDTVALKLDESVYNFAKRTLTDDLTDWKPFNAERGAMNATPIADGLLITRADGTNIQLSLKGEKPTAAAFIPQSSLIALALIDQNMQTVFRLFDTQSGRPLRMFTGHSARIRGIAASNDGRLLASISDDQTICVWSLTDLARVRDKLGQVDGLAIREKDGELIVDQPDAGGQLKVGDKLLGIVEDQKLIKATKAVEVYRAIRQREPKSDILIRTNRGDITLKVAQGVDEVKPLLSMFITGEGKERDWLLWSPFGDYDSSAVAVERLIGWHFNPEKEGERPSFVGADKHRNTYRKPGLMEFLVRRGDLPTALDDLRKKDVVPDPRMMMYLDGIDRPADGSATFIRRRDYRLRLIFQHPTFPIDRIESVTWTFDGGEPQPFSFDDDDRIAMLTKLDWTRGFHTIEATTKMNGPYPQEFSTRLPIRYQPPAPVIRLGELKLVTDQPKWELEAKVIGDEPFTVRLVHQDEKAREVPAMIKESLTLKPGRNTITIEAVNRDALVKYESHETSRQVIEVEYRPVEIKVAPPRIDIKGVQEINGRFHPFVPGQIISVATPNVTLQGTITSTELLKVARRGEVPFANFKAETVKQFAIEEVLPLNPGDTTIDVFALATVGESNSRTIKLNYVPALPNVALEQPVEGQIIVEGIHPRKMVMKAKFALPSDPQPFTVQLIHNGKAGDIQNIGAQTKSWEGAIELAQGKNHFEWRLANKWGAIASIERNVVWKRPPAIMNVANTVPNIASFVDLTALIASPNNLPPLLATVSDGLHERSFTAMSFEKIPALLPDGRFRWKLTMKRMPIEFGDNRFTLTVRNADGSCIEPATFPVITLVAPPPPKPQVVFAVAQENVLTDDPNFTLSAVIRSDSALEELVIRRERDDTKVIDVTKLRPQGDVWTMSLDQEFRLNKGVNTFDIVAVNRGGKSEGVRTVTYTPAPPHIVIDSLSPIDEQDTIIRPTERACFAKSPSAMVRLRGHIVCRDDRNTEMNGHALIRARVNEYQQFPSVVQPMKDRKRSFTLDLLLTKPTANRIELNVTGIGIEATFVEVKTCANPIRDQRLHVVIIGVGLKDPKVLKQDVIDLLQAKSVNGQNMGGGIELYTSQPAFAEVHMYPPLYDYVTAPQVNHLLQKLEGAIRTARRADRTPASDVVMFYYRGTEGHDEGGYYYLTSDSDSDPTAVIRANELGKRFSASPGTAVMFLDVAAPGMAKKQAFRPIDHGMGYFRLRQNGVGPNAVRLPPLVAANWATSAQLRELNNGLLGWFDKNPQMDAEYDAAFPESLSDLRFGGNAR